MKEPIIEGVWRLSFTSALLPPCPTVSDKGHGLTMEMSALPGFLTSLERQIICDGLDNEPQWCMELLQRISICSIMIM